MEKLIKEEEYASLTYNRSVIDVKLQGSIGELKLNSIVPVYIDWDLVNTGGPIAAREHLELVRDFSTILHDEPASIGFPYIYAALDFGEGNYYATANGGCVCRTNSCGVREIKLFSLNGQPEPEPNPVEWFIYQEIKRFQSRVIVYTRINNSAFLSQMSSNLCRGKTIVKSRSALGKGYQFFGNTLSGEDLKNSYLKSAYPSIACYNKKVSHQRKL